MGSLLRGAGAIALLLCLAGPAAQAQQAPDAPATARAGSLVFRDVTFGAVKIGSVELNGVVQDGTDVQVNSALVTNLGVEIGPFSLRFPEIRATRLHTARQFLDAFTAPSTRTDWIDLLATMSAERVTAPSLTYRLELPQVDMEATTNGLLLDRLEKGRVAVLGFDSQEGETKMPEPAASSTTRAGPTRYEEVDFGESLRFFSGGGSGPAKMLLARGEQQGAESRDSNGAAIRMGRILTRAVYGRAPREGLTFEDLEALRGGKPDPAVIQKIGRMLTEMADTLRIEGGAVEDFSMEMPVGSVGVSIKSMTIGDYSLKGLGLFEIRDLAVTAPDTEVTLGRFAIEKLDYGRLVDFGLSFLRSASPPDAKPVEIPPLVPTLGAMRFENLDVDSPAGPLSLGGFTFGTTASGGMPDSLTTTLSRLAIDLPALPPTDGTAKLIELGYPEILADVRFAVRYDKGAGTLSLERSGASVDDAGSVEATLGLQGINVDAMLETVGRAPELAMQAQFGSLSVHIADLGFAQRFYDNVSKSAGVAPEAIRDGLAAQLRAQATAMFGPALAPSSADQIAQFLRAPGKLTIRVEPRSDRPPLMIGELQGLPPPQLADRISVTIEAVPK